MTFPFRGGLDSLSPRTKDVAQRMTSQVETAGARTGVPLRYGPLVPSFPAVLASEEKFPGHLRHASVDGTWSVIRLCGLYDLTRISSLRPTAIDLLQPRARSRTSRIGTNHH